MNLICPFFILLTTFTYCAQGRNYPTFKQCDSVWGEETLGTSDTTICEAGSLVSSIAMGLTGAGISYTPSAINDWLTEHNGYVNGDLFVWTSINELGLVFEGKISNEEIKSKIDQDRIVISNLHNGKSWLIVTGYSGDRIIVHDPLNDNSSYELTDVIEGQNGVYRISGTNLRFE